MGRSIFYEHTSAARMYVASSARALVASISLFLRICIELAVNIYLNRYLSLCLCLCVYFFFLLRHASAHAGIGTPRR